MATLEWLKKAFNYGYDSGEILSGNDCSLRKKEEAFIGGSYLELFKRGIEPYVSSKSMVIELGPGRGSWTQAILSLIDEGQVHTVDFQDAAQWLNPESWKGRLVCHKVDNNSFDCLASCRFDFFWSFGVLCHNTSNQIYKILKNAKPKMKPGSIAVHQYGNWDKLAAFGWAKGGIPDSFKKKKDEDIWWPRNTAAKMADTAEKAGWKVLSIDLDLFERDSVIVLKA